jgi:hypothetical protein
MTTETRCELTGEVNFVQDDGTTRYGCEHCRRNAPEVPINQRDREPHVGVTITAAFPGRCPACDDRIHEGDAICTVDDEWVHVECAP